LKEDLMFPLPSRKSRSWTNDLRGARHRTRHRQRPLTLELLETRDLLSGVWTSLVNKAPSTTGTMMMLADGTVMVQGGGSAAAVKTWYQLTPDNSGDYTNGMWTQRQSMNLERLYYGSNVLPDGRVFVQGGEYSGPGTVQNFTNTGEIYDPVTDSWTKITNFPQSQFGDDPTVVLRDGRILAGYLAGPQTYLYDPATDTWSQTGSKLRNDRSDEETFLLLPDGSVLTTDVFSNQTSQRYDPASGTWVDAGTIPVPLSSSAVGFEMGPATMLPDGRAFFVGATNHTALYDPSTNTWTAGPDLPAGMGADDAPGALLANGHFLFAADRPLFHAPTSIFDYDPVANTLTQVGTTGVDLNHPAYVSRLLALPTQQVLLTTSTSQLYLYTPDGAPNPSWKPIIRNIRDNGDGTFGLAGLRLNGISEGASYGDDAEMSSNYPLVQLTDADGNVTYARTFNWNPGVVQSGSTFVTTQFTLPAGIAPGDYQLRVSAAGILSDPVLFTVNGPTMSLAGLRLGNAAPASTEGSQFATPAPVVSSSANVGVETTGLADQVTAPLSTATPSFLVTAHGLPVAALDASFVADPLGQLL
jgi:hypothetical protein